MTRTSGLNHLGLSVYNLDETVDFFVDCLGWTEAGRDLSYPRSAVSDGQVRLTLWQVDHSAGAISFDRRKNIGLHHVAFQVDQLVQLDTLAQKVREYPGVNVEFMPELVGEGPRVHMMFTEPGGIRIELCGRGTTV